MNGVPIPVPSMADRATNTSLPRIASAGVIVDLTQIIFGSPSTTISVVLTAKEAAKNRIFHLIARCH